MAKHRELFTRASLLSILLMLVACGEEAAPPAAAAGLDCDATQRLSVGQSYETEDGRYQITVHELATGRSATDGAGVSYTMVDADIEVCRLMPGPEAQFTTYDFGMCLVGPAMFGDEKVNGHSYSNTGMEALEPELAPYPAFADGCERGWLGFPEIWSGPQEGVQTLGVYYSPNYQDAVSPPRVLWEMP